MKRKAAIKAKSPAPTERAAIQRDVKTWARASVALRKIKMAELAALTDDDTRRLVAALLDPVFTRNAYVDPWRVSYSGLVEQQRIFMKLRA
ncbi:MAG TPA: hypothetical protein PKY66_16640 [Thermoflexales bacterium]|jgi:hypothetical protein|nr:hypothetical protein [Thermoflexales bacterium]HQX12049.1 hypothetical protein [Thermoflexales bacterium]